MKLNELDLHASGTKPITNCIRWLRSCLSSCVNWTPEQRTAAEQAVAQAEEVLGQVLTPNVTQEHVFALLTPVTREASPLPKLLANQRDGVAVTGTDLLTLNLWEGALLAKMEAMEAVLADVSRRIAFLNWPAETFWNAGTDDRPHWVPDWRRELALLEAARHGTDFRHPDERPTLPWNQIPEEHRPCHKNEARKRLHELHLAWLNYCEEAGEPRTQREYVNELLKFKDAAQRVFERKPTPMPMPAQVEGDFA